MENSVLVQFTIRYEMTYSDIQRGKIFLPLPILGNLVEDILEQNEKVPQKKREPRVPGSQPWTSVQVAQEATHLQWAWRMWSSE